MKQIFPVLVLLVASLTNAQTLPEPVQKAIDDGNFTSAQDRLRSLIAEKQASATEVYEYSFAIDRLDRIRRDFPKDRAAIERELRKYYLENTREMVERYEADGSLEMLVIDGEKRYFVYAVPNLFRVNAEARKRRDAVEGPPKDELDDFLARELPPAVSACSAAASHRGRPVHLTLDYTVTVNANAVPADETIRCWLPYPREGHDRQADVRLVSVNAPDYVIAGRDRMQRTLYAEKTAVKDVPTVFRMQLDYTCSSEKYDLSQAVRADAAIPEEIVREYTAERPPHIVFTDAMKQLSRRIVGDEQDPVRKAKLIFSWISATIPWASAREYSTIPNISAYCLGSGHGDCGIRTLFFMTLCRLNGIPTKWQSGWMLHPVEVNLHDWCEMYVAGTGWVPVDQSFGVQPSSDEQVKYYYFGGIDSYRFIVNDDFSAPLYPAKIYPRSETVDFQRGELEWRGGNLYFDSWRYAMRVTYK
jgi:transglutaminase-like putative cysteine protease